MNKSKFLRTVRILTLCAAICVSSVMTAFAAGGCAADKQASYYFNGERTADFSAAGTYDVKWNVYNYDEENAVTAALVTGVFKNGILENVVTGRFDSIAGGGIRTLEQSVVLGSDDSGSETGRTLKTFLWKSIQSMTPMESTPPQAPYGVLVNETSVTNSTVDIAWTAPAQNIPVVRYNVYRNGTDFVGSTFGTETSFKDVGIEHNTEVFYRVSSVDFAGTESELSAPSEKVTTSDIARLWLGGLPEGTVLTKDNLDEINASGAYNLTASGVTGGEIFTAPSGGRQHTTRITAHAADYHYDAANDKSLVLGAMDFETAGSRIMFTLNDAFLEKVKDDDEIKLIMNYYDDKPFGSSEGGSFGNFSILARYSTSADSSPALSGATGKKLANTLRWKTAKLTLPTIKNSVVNNSVGGEYPDVFRNRHFDFKVRTSSEQLSQSKNNTSAYTLGYPAAFCVGSNNAASGGQTGSVKIQKIDIAGKNYIPYGAVLDLDKQSDSQYIELISRDGYNQNEIAAHEGKTAFSVTASKDIKLALSGEYIGQSDSKTIVRVTYFDNKTDTDNYSALQLRYPSSNAETESGMDGSNYIKRTGSNTWKTAQLFLDDAAFSDALTALQLGTKTGSEWFVSRIEVINRLPD